MTAVTVAVVAAYALMTTKGPVFSIRIRLRALQGDFIDDRWVQTVFVIGGLVVGAVCIAAIRRLLADRTLLGATALFVAVVGASSLWSVAPRRTTEQAVMLLIGSAAALIAGARLSNRQMLVAWWVAAQSGLLVSEFALRRHWQFSIGESNYPAGIYFNRNSLGAVAAIGLLTGVVALGDIVQRRTARWFLPAAALVLALGFDAWMLRRTGSVTPAVALGVTAVACGLVRASLAIRWTPARRGTLAGASIVAAVVAGIAYQRRQRSGPISALSGRDVVWDVLFDYWAKRPVQGWGYMAIWTRDDIAQEQFARGVLVFEAHSGYFETLIGVGIVGVLALAAVVVLAGSRFWYGIRSATSIGAAWPAIAVAYCLIINVGETYIGPNLHPWILLLMVLPQLRRRGSQDPS